MRPYFSYLATHALDICPPTAVQRSRMRAEMSAERALRQHAEKGSVGVTMDNKGDNFYQLLQEAKDLLPDNSWWVQ